MKTLRLFVTLVGFGSASLAAAQEVGACATADSVAFRGNRFVADSVLRLKAGIVSHSTVTAPALARAIRSLYTIDQLQQAHIATSCEIAGGKSLLVFNVRESSVRPNVGTDALTQDVGACARADSVAFRGNRLVSDSVLRLKVGVAPHSTLTPAGLARALRSLYTIDQLEQGSIATTCETAGGKTVLVFTIRERR
jgi:outer membrane protein assembly factor BamA